MTKYVPLLKGKEGEFAALEVLTADVRAHITPLIEVPGVPYDFANERPAKSVDAHVANIGERLRKCWPNAPFYLDVPRFGDEDRLADGRVALAGVLEDCVAAKVSAVPVVSRSSSPACLLAAQNHCLGSGLGLCLRLTVEDFEEEIDTDAEVTRILEGVSQISMDVIDLVVDLEDLGSDTGRAALIARSVLGMIPHVIAWRRVVLAAASFPEDLSEVDAATVTTLPRREWELWSMLQRRPKLLPRQDLIFGDYGIAHPVPKELDPRTMRMSASIRYTTRDNWLVIKGRNVRQYGFEQYFELCRTLVGRAEYSGALFSWGDDYISKCAQRESGPGNATTWRKVGTNHHLTFVARQLANAGA